MNLLQVIKNNFVLFLRFKANQVILIFIILKLRSVQDQMFAYKIIYYSE